MTFKWFFSQLKKTARRRKISTGIKQICLFVHAKIFGFLHFCGLMHLWVLDILLVLQFDTWIWRRTGMGERFKNWNEILGRILKLIYWSIWKFSFGKDSQGFFNYFHQIFFEFSVQNPEKSSKTFKQKSILFMAKT